MNREHDVPREKHPSIELSDRQLLEINDAKRTVLKGRQEKPYIAELVYRPPADNPDLLDETTPIGKKYKIAKDLTKDIKTVKPYEKSSRKAAKKVTKKPSRKANAAAVAKV